VVRIFLLWVTNIDAQILVYIHVYVYILLKEVYHSLMPSIGAYMRLKPLPLHLHSLNTILPIHVYSNSPEMSSKSDVFEKVKNM
jgi:hypothetical protein